MGSGQVEASVKDILCKVPGMGQEVKQFSQHLASLYNGQIQVPNTTEGREYCRLRNEVATQGLIYCNFVMPINRTCISKLQMYAEMYEYMDFNKWRQNISLVREQTETFYNFFSALLYIHEELLLNGARSSKSKVETLGQNLQRERTSLQTEIKEKKGPIGAWWLMAVPIVNVVALPFVTAAQVANSKNVNSLRERHDMTLKVENAINGKLIPGLENYINGLISITSFFQVMKEELNQFNYYSRNEEEMFFNILRQKANEIKGVCRRFISVIPEVTHNFSFISNDEVQWSTYNWFLEERNAIIRKICGPCKAIELIN